MALLVANKVTSKGELYTLEALEDMKNQMIEKGYNAIIEREILYILLFTEEDIKSGKVKIPGNGITITAL
jgi:hypothetical protein